ncbi:unnamed protein product [Schistosoma mattheei]|uniref:Uncharacterized protein n=1 Tax=Schistosoma mattheei TaxID=31246 RepID=A0A183Q5I7_9TREM|nr:unnamed protein product [Schistosoma mattheei]
MSEEQRININNEYCPITRLSYPLSYLTGINEDIRGELVHSIIDLQQQHQQQSMNTCAVPINVCCVCSNDENDLQSLHSDVQVLCATPGCKYSKSNVYICIYTLIFENLIYKWIDIHGDC